MDFGRFNLMGYRVPGTPPHAAARRNIRPGRRPRVTAYPAPDRLEPPPGPGTAMHPFATPDHPAAAASGAA